MRVQLTPMQHRIAAYEAAGLPRAEIARRIDRSTNYVATTLYSLRQRYGTRSREALARLVLSAEVREPDHCYRVGASGLRRGDPVRIVGGRFKGRRGHYVRVHCGQQWYVQIGGGVFCVTSKYVQPDPLGLPAPTSTPRLDRYRRQPDSITEAA